MGDKSASTRSTANFAEDASSIAPIIYFDVARTFGFNAGIASITIEAFTYVSPGSNVRAERRVVAHLRTSATGLLSLKKAIAAIELSLRPAEGQKDN
jgi:hypothetical protein